MGFNLPEDAKSDNTQDTSKDYVGALVGKFGDKTGNLRIATDDPRIREDIASALGGTFYTHTGPDGKPAKREFGIDLGTRTLDVLIEKFNVYWAKLENGTYGKRIKVSDGSTITYADGTSDPDPEAQMGLKERFERYANGRTDLALFVDITFRLADAPELGLIDLRKNAARVKDGKTVGVSFFYGLNLSRKTGPLAKFEAAAVKPVPATLVSEGKEGASGEYFTTEVKIK